MTKSNNEENDVKQEKIKETKELETKDDVNDSELNNESKTNNNSDNISNTPPEIPTSTISEKLSNNKTNNTKRIKFFENKFLCIGLAIATFILLIVVVNQSSEVNSLKEEVNQLTDELNTAQEKYEELQKTPGIEIISIREAFNDEQWETVIDLAEDFDEKYKDSKENTEAQDLKTKAQEKLDEIAKQEEEERKAKEEQERQEEAERQAAQQRQNEIANASLGEQNALGTAQDYLNVMGFSRQGLKEQLMYEGYSDAEAEFALNHITVDWNLQAQKVAQNYIDTMSFSRQGLLEQLLYEGFTQEQAEYGVSSVGY
ncbi:hypothetical protein E0K99_08030 [Faecalicoccus pleomorphus]|uniref:Ltp family lipoprotein n=1 Tax=Faecalicoccus pleomorphus TaxID=1323 RepID=UPI001430A725|nr:Ltp family lipoprotein [Faecalicoccus pleomorphus]NJE41265.1 hypothetical protein [Faecalicoccus pleomorphus]